MNIDNQEFYDELTRKILRSWGGDYMKPTSVRKHDGATIYTVYRKGHFVIAGTIFELDERARLNERAKRQARR